MKNFIKKLFGKKIEEPVSEEFYFINREEKISRFMDAENINIQSILKKEDLEGKVKLGEFFYFYTKLLIEIKTKNKEDKEKFEEAIKEFYEFGRPIYAHSISMEEKGEKKDFLIFNFNRLAKSYDCTEGLERKKQILGIKDEFNYCLTDYNGQEDLVPTPFGISYHGKCWYANLGCKELNTKISMEHVLLTGETFSGKSNLQRMIIKSLTHSYSPDELQFVFLDTDNGNFKMFKNSGYEEQFGYSNTQEGNIEVLKKLKIFVKEREEFLGRENFEEFRTKDGVSLKQVIVCIPYFQDFYSGSFTQAKGTFEEYPESLQLFKKILEKGEQLGIAFLIEDGQCLRPFKMQEEMKKFLESFNKTLYFRSSYNNRFDKRFEVFLEHGEFIYEDKKEKTRILMQSCYA